MGLDFTGINDSHGSAIYLIHDGTEKDRTFFEKLAADIGNRTKKQIISMSIDDEDATKIVSFYQLKGDRFVLIIRDDDQLHHIWSNHDRFDASQIAFTAEQAG